MKQFTAFHALLILIFIAATSGLVQAMDAPRIAVIGWGSLVWNPAPAGQTALKAARMQRGGPVLPLAFSRVSSDGRLTLVIDPRSEGERTPKDKVGRDVETWFAVSEYPVDQLDTALENLRNREGNPAKARIGFVNLRTNTFRITQLSPQTGDPVTITGTIRLAAPDVATVDIAEGSGIRKELLPYLKGIIAWAVRNRFDAAIWTDLQRNFKEKTGKKFNKANALAYVASLRDEKRRLAREYIQKTPENVLNGTRDGRDLLAALR